MPGEFYVIVVGAGAMGTAAARSLSKRGRHVVLLERFRSADRLGVQRAQIQVHAADRRILTDLALAEPPPLPLPLQRFLSRRPALQV